MNNRSRFFVVVLVCTVSLPLFAQDSLNCFLRDFEPREAAIPPYQTVEKTSEKTTVTVTINSADTLGRISKYILGNALAVWLGYDVNNATVVGYMQKMAPSLIRFPGGSWSDIYFWNGNPGDLPMQIPDGTQNGKMVSLFPQFGPGHLPTVDGYYRFRDQIGGAQGLITINYGYARYGIGDKPVERAAHLAADWVRYDGGQTKFWEIGNENAGPWEAGWQIDTTVNKDGQPQIINGALYGRHFRVFADSMRAAAAELDETIYIGGQVIHYNSADSWNIGERGWNEGFWREAGDEPDFYVMHNYFGNSTSSIKNQIDVARNEINRNIAYIRQDVAARKAPVRPVALTEWNCGGPDLAKTSIANGMQAVVLFCEMINNNFGMSARWLLANWESDGLLYIGSNASIPRWNPRPDYFYIYYLQKFIGDHAVSTSVSGSPDVLAYASQFHSGEEAVVVLNKGTASQIIQLDPKGYGVGDRFYVYSLTGVDDSTWPQAVVVNDHGPTGKAWGPLDGLENIAASAYTIGKEIKFISPPRSTQFILIDAGKNVVPVEVGDRTGILGEFSLYQNFPNPFNPRTEISYAMPVAGLVSLHVYNITGQLLGTLLREERKPAGVHTVVFDAANLPGGIYFYSMDLGGVRMTRKMLLIK